MPPSFLEKVLPSDSFVTYLGRGDQDPECGFVGYNLKHAELEQFNNEWEALYSNDEIFKLTSGWTDCSSLIYLIDKYHEQSKTKSLISCFERGS